MTNIGWVIDAREIERQFSIPSARLINDFLANGYGLLTLDDAQTITLQVPCPHVWYMTVYDCI